MEEFVEPLPSREEFTRAREPGEEQRNLFDRKVGYFRWRWLVAHRRVAVADQQSLPEIPPGGEVEVRSEIMPLRRGRLLFNAVTLLRPDPFGLLKSLITVSAKQTLLVLPMHRLTADTIAAGLARL